MSDEGHAWNGKTRLLATGGGVLLAALAAWQGYEPAMSMLRPGHGNGTRLELDPRIRQNAERIAHNQGWLESLEKRVDRLEDDQEKLEERIRRLEQHRGGRP